jgi:hypothetical protein
MGVAGMLFPRCAKKTLPLKTHGLQEDWPSRRLAVKKFGVEETPLKNGLEDWF